MIAWPSSLTVVSVGTLLVMGGEGILFPVLPLYARTFGASAALVGLVVGSAGLARILFNLPAGAVTDFVGRRPLLIVGPLITCVSTACAGIAGSLGQLLLFRFLAGAGNGIFMTGALVLLSDIPASRERLHAISLFRTMVIVGITVGPILGGLVAEQGGLRVPFFTVAGLAGTAAVWSLLLRKEKRERPAPDSQFRPVADNTSSRIRSAFRNRGLMLASLVTFTMFFTIIGAQQSILPLLARMRMGWGPTELGFLVSVISGLSLAAIWPAAWLAGRTGTTRVIVLGCLALAAGLLVFATGSAVGPFVVAAVLVGVGTGLAGPSATTYASGASRTKVRGTAMGTYQMLGESGFVAGPLILGWAAEVSTLGWALALNAALAIGVALAFGLLATEPRDA